MSPTFRHVLLLLTPALVACDSAPKSDPSSASSPRTAANVPPAPAPAEHEAKGDDTAKAPPTAAADDGGAGDEAAAADDGVAGDDAAAGDDGADAEDEGGAAASGGGKPTVTAKVVLGLPPAAAWTASGPFASTKLGAGPLRVEPEEAGDGELPQSPEKGIDPDTGTPMNHIERYGWSADGESFAMCAANESECLECIFVDDAGKQQRMNMCGRKSKAEARWNEGKYTKGPLTWPAGGDITIGWEAFEVAEEDGPDLVVTAAVDGTKTVENLSRMRFALGSDGLAFPEVLALDADGSRLAVVGHGWMGEGSDEWQVRILGTGWLAAEAYGAAGLKFLRDGKATEAAAMFAKATVADPSAWKGPYNAACAWARAKDAQAEAALTEAIARGGDVVVNKARRDADFDGVRGESWFVALVPAA